MLAKAEGVPTGLDTAVTLSYGYMSDNCRVVIVRGVGIVEYNALCSPTRESGQLIEIVPGKP